jgi:hypothetical protein
MAAALFAGHGCAREPSPSDMHVLRNRVVVGELSLEA